ncbi:hypothetical protein EDC19_1179 [Natranaerovirga hydrolytica]|uniref:Permease n=1 Tax=Natranaerovirga hydrolytica TaxID=680378 RepID=A0A4R1N3U8_9FIRM|nr:permease [Natranaerovirga hydrolytica]TCK98744.1 hypothetical protein EDC19_1179 [Natranaerovirga hydrolytica]
MGILSNLWTFIQTQILGMQWLNDLVAFLLDTMGLDTTSRLGSSLQFFIYDVIKILILLCVLIFLISYIQSFFPPERTKRIIGRFKGVKANFVGALLGILTPFCSCSSIPLFIGFSSAGLPVGVTFSFLIASPLIDLAAFSLLISYFGIRISIVYVVVGVLLAVIGGSLIDKLGLEKYVEDFVRKGKTMDVEEQEQTLLDRVAFAKEQMVSTLKKVWLYVVIGVGIGAGIHNYIPQEMIENVLGSNNPFSVIIATVFGIPMYANIFGAIPVADALFLKNVPIGTILSFMMSVTALSLPSIIMLKKAIKARLLFTFVGIVSIGIILIGYLFNIFGHLII